MKYTLRHFAIFSSLVLGATLSSNTLATERTNTFDSPLLNVQSQNGQNGTAANNLNSPIKKVRDRSNTSTHVLKRLMSLSSKQNVSSRATQLIHSSLPQGVSTAH